MPDRSELNLLRIRAYDEFNEADHPRADNGQFTSGGGGSAPAEKPKRARKPKAEKDWEPSEAEKISWRISVSEFNKKKFNPKKATPKQMENREKQAKHVIEMIREESARTARYGRGGQNEKDWRYLNQLWQSIDHNIRLEKQRYEDAHRGEQ